MNCRFVVPVIVAAAAHGLLFALPRGSVPPQAAPLIPSLLLRPVPRPFEVVTPETKPEETARQQPSGAIDAAPRTVDEPRPDNGTGFRVPVEPQPLTNLNPNAIRITSGVFGPIGTGIGDIDGNAIVRSIALDRAPHARVQIAPEYPFAARQDGRSGEVIVDFTVDEAGRVISPYVTRSSDPVFNDSAVRAVSHWRFEPGTVHGCVVRFRMSVPLVFHLDN